jgi:hypothetical protein
LPIRCRRRPVTDRGHAEHGQAGNHPGPPPPSAGLSPGSCRAFGGDLASAAPAYATAGFAQQQHRVSTPPGTAVLKPRSTSPKTTIRRRR